jgi:hypothetical protein
MKENDKTLQSIPLNGQSGEVQVSTTSLAHGLYVCVFKDANGTIIHSTKLVIVR